MPSDAMQQKVIEETMKAVGSKGLTIVAALIILWRRSSPNMTFSSADARASAIAGKAFAAELEKPCQDQ